MNFDFTKRAALLALSFGVISTSGFAAGADHNYPNDPDFKSTKTRAEAIAEIVQARAQGLLELKEHEYPVIEDRASTRTKADVRPDAFDALRNRAGSVNLYSGK